MAQMFGLKSRDLMLLKKFYKRAPKKFQQAASNVLNSYAFGTREKNIKIIKTKMTVRDERFVKSSIRVIKARSTDSINRMSSTVASVKRRNFSGWEEQEFGTASNKTRTNTLLSRGGDMKRKQMPSTRLKSSNRFIHPDDFDFPGVKNKNIPFLVMLRRKKHRKPFKLKKGRKSAPGLYKMRKGQPRQLQKFGKKKITPMRVRWMSEGSRQYFKANDPRRTFQESINRVLKYK